MARDALEQQHNTINRMTVLEVQVGEMRDRLWTVQSLASQTMRDSTDAYNQALNIYQQSVTLQVPDADHERLIDQAEKIQREADRIKEEAERLITENADLLREAQDRRVGLEDLLNR